MRFVSETEEYDSRSQHDLDRWVALHMVFSITNTASKDDTIIAEVIYPGRSFGDCNETT